MTESFVPDNTHDSFAIQRSQLTRVMWRLRIANAQRFCHFHLNRGRPIDKIDKLKLSLTLQLRCSSTALILIADCALYFFADADRAENIGSVI